jgi:tetratricopeptide (TPR) repeat protein
MMAPRPLFALPLLACLALPVAAETPGAEPQPGGEAAAAYQFALAKVLSEDGRMLEALELYPRAVAAAPDDPYIRIEYAELLLRAAQRFSAGSGRVERLAEAARQAEAAQRLAPGNVETLKALGQVHLSLSEVRGESFEAAVAAFEGVRRQAPWDLQSMVTLGQIYLQQRKPAQAVEVFREVSRYTPDNRIVYALLGDALVEAGLDGEAEEVLRKHLELDPRALDARLDLVKILARRDDHRGAVEVLEATPADLKGERQVRDERVWQLYLAGRLDEALAGSEAIVAADPDGTWPRFVHALILAGLERNDEALAEIEALRSSDPENLELARTAAGVLERQGRPDEAERVLAELLSRLDERAAGSADGAEARARARFLLAGIQARAGRRDEAAATLAPLLTAADAGVRAEATAGHAGLLFESGRRQEALALLDRAAAGLPVLRAKQVELLLTAGEDRQARKLVARLGREVEEPDVLLQVAQAAQQKERYDLSLELLERVLAADAERVDALFLTGAAYERSGQIGRAVVTFRRLLAVDADFAPALNYLGYLWAERGENLGEALTLVTRAVDLDPDNGAYVDSLGWALYRLGRLEEARAQLEKAAELLPEDPTICEHLADLYTALGDTDRAEALYRRALDLAAENAADLRRKLDRLRID